METGLNWLLTLWAYRDPEVCSGNRPQEVLIVHIYIVSVWETNNRFVCTLFIKSRYFILKPFLNLLKQHIKIHYL